MLDTHIENLAYKYGYSNGLIHDAMTFERNKIIRREYTLKERYFSGSRIRTKIEQDATDKAYKILDRYYRLRQHAEHHTIGL